MSIAVTLVDIRDDEVGHLYRLTRYNTSKRMDLFKMIQADTHDYFDTQIGSERERTFLVFNIPYQVQQ